MTAGSIPSERVRPIRRIEFEKMAEAGLFAGERVELVYGVIVRMAPKGPLHESALQRLTRLLVRALDTRAVVRIQSSFAASDGSEPEPDVAVVPTGEYRAAHPSEAHLLVEVADSSLDYDRTTKARLYAECGVPEYWVVNVRDGLVEVHTEIVERAYTRVRPARRGERVQLLRFPDVEVAIDDVL